MTPLGQERGRHIARTTATGKAYTVVYTPRRTREAQAKIVNAWIAAGRPKIPAGIAFRCEVVAAWPRPKSHVKADGTLTSAGLAMPYPTKPDVDNVLKLVLDALQPECFPDDARCHTATAKKVYADAPYLEITLRW